MSRNIRIESYPSHICETFFNSVEGAFFKREMSRARQDKRIGQPVPFDPYRPVNTFWDIGMDDETAIWFPQTDGVRYRLIDFYSNSDEGLSPPRVEASLAPSNSRRPLTAESHDPEQFAFSA